MTRYERVLPVTHKNSQGYRSCLYIKMEATILMYKQDRYDIQLGAQIHAQL